MDNNGICRYTGGAQACCSILLPTTIIRKDILGYRNIDKN